MSTIIIITPPPKKDPAAPESVSFTATAGTVDYAAAVALIQEAEAAGSPVRIVNAD